MQVVREFTNMTAHGEPGDALILFLGKNSDGEASAEMLNQMQLDGRLHPLVNRPRKRGFYRILLTHWDAIYLNDLREATGSAVGYPGRPLLVGPEGRPPTFVVPKRPLADASLIPEDDHSYRTGGENDEGRILPKPD